MSRRGGTSGSAGGTGTAQRKINLNASGSKKRRSFIPGPPLRPQRKLFVGLMIGFAAWAAVLVALYFVTPDPVHAPTGLRAPEAQPSEAR
jgi:hypothetical protein